MKGSWKWKVAQKLELKWWKKYLKGTDLQEYLKYKHQYWIDFLKSIKLDYNALQNTFIYDVGCGPAGIFTILSQSKVIAVDPLLNQYKTELSVFNESKYPWVLFQSSTIESYKFGQKADSVFCLNVINHVIDIPKTLVNLNAGTKLGGQIIVSTDAHNFLLLKLIFKLIPGDMLHPHQYSQNEYKHFIENAGFKVTEEICLNRAFIFRYVVFKATKTIDL